MAAINPVLKHFFFTAFKSRREFKESEKAIGKIKSVSIIITDEKTIMRAESATEKVDTTFTPEEKRQLLKTFKVKEETIQDCKSIFLMMDMDNKSIHIRQTKKDGTKKEIDL